MRPKTKTKTAASFMILVLLMPSELWAQDPPKKTESPTAACNKLTPKATWINCYWSSKDSRGKVRATSANKAGWTAKKEADAKHLEWAGFDVAKELRQHMFLTYVGADQLHNPFADRIVVQRFWDLGGDIPTPAPEFVVFAPDADEAQVRKDFLEYLQRTDTPPSTLEVTSVEWKPAAPAPPSPNATSTDLANPSSLASKGQPSTRVVSANPNK